MANKFPKMTKSEMLSLVRETADSLKKLGSANIANLAKADPSAPPAEGSSPSASGSAEGSSGSPEGSADAGGPPPGAEGSAPPPDAGGPPPGAEGSAPPPGAEGSAPPPGAEGSAPPPGAEGAPQGPTFQELVQLYSALPPPDLEAHAAAMQQAMAMKQGAGAGAPPPGAEGSAPPPPGASPSAPPPPGMVKQEVATHDPNIGLKPGTGTPGKVETANPNIGPTKKSESDELAALRKNLEDLGHVVETILTIPQRKAVTGLTIVPMRKSEEPVKSTKKAFADLTKNELRAVLNEVTKPDCAKLSKSERAAVTDYCLNPHSVDLSVIEGIYNKA